MRLEWRYVLSSATAVILSLAVVAPPALADDDDQHERHDPVVSGDYEHVLLISVDGMHAVDLYNCTHGINGANGGDPYCPNLATLTHTGINYVATVSSKPSDSFPGLAALVTGGSPKTTGLYYDVAYDRSLDAPALLTGTGLAAGPCTPYGVPTGTTTDYDQGIEIDDTKLNGGAVGASLTDGGIASIDSRKLVRDPANGYTTTNFPGKENDTMELSCRN